MKNIIASFIDKNIDEINDKTIIDKTVIKGSILIHRLYAALAKEGYLVKDYSKIVTYGDLTNTLNGGSFNHELINEKVNHNGLNDEIKSIGINLSIGIDIEKISNLPLAIDFRSDEFYTQNFTPKEISYCILQKNPIESFAGLFCVKEAIFKANNNLQIEGKFNSIEITHTINGSPIFPGFSISLSHSDDTVVAVAISL